jgi:L-lactate dehydrogenase complex protein LldG
VSSARSAVFEGVRRALGRAAGEAIATPPPGLPAREAGSPDAEIDLLLQEITALSGVAQRVQPEAVENAVARLVESEGVRRATLWSTPRLGGLGVESALRRHGVEIVSPLATKHALAQCDLGVTEADFALPETGTLGLLSSAEKPRAVSLLPRIHLALVSPAVLRADLHQVFELAKAERYLVFVTGPSRTADIELTVTLGVHGPQALHVWVVLGEQERHASGRPGGQPGGARVHEPGSLRAPLGGGPRSARAEASSAPTSRCGRLLSARWRPGCCPGSRA